MENKRFIQNIQDKLVSSIKQVQEQSSQINFKEKQELIDTRFQDSFNEIVSVIEDMTHGRVDYSYTNRILSQVEDEFGNTKSAIARSLQRERENVEDNFDINGMLNNLVSNFGNELEEITALENEDISQTGISQNLSKIQGNLDDSREDAYKSARSKFNYEVEDTIMTELKHRLNSILNRSGMQMSVDIDELQYHVNRILSSKLLEPILDGSNEIDMQTLKQAGIDEDTILSEVYDEISKEINGQEKEVSEEEKQLEDPSDSFQKELMGEVKTNAEMFRESSVVEESQERTTTREDLEAMFK